VGPVAFAAPVQVHVGQQELLFVGAALERDPEGLSHPAAGAVAADEPAGVDLFCRVGIAVSDRGYHARVHLAEARELAGTFDRTAQLEQAFDEWALDAGLGRDPEPGIGRVEVRSPAALSVRSSRSPA
jgi:hypothetical protein